MSERKVQRYVVSIQQVLDTTGVFTRTIYVPFIPHELKVKQIGFFDLGNTVGLWSVNCDSLAQQTGSNLGYFFDPCVSFTGITYALRTSPNGAHTFQLLNSNGVPATPNGSRIAIHLEFRRYE